jgi:hypothetical protein
MDLIFGCQRLEVHRERVGAHGFGNNRVLMEGAQGWKLAVREAGKLPVNSVYGSYCFS